MSRLLKYFEKNKKVADFGVNYLDDKLGGVLRSDLIVVGARSGAGKSTLSNIIAMSNPNIKLALFSLENFDGDDYAKECFYNYMKISGKYNMDMRRFVSGQYQLEPYFLEEAERLANNKLNHIKLISRSKDYNVSKLKDDMISAVANDGCELLIIDHLDYLDKDNPADNDVTHMTELMRTIRELQDDFGVAVIAISHLRKPANAKFMPAVPSVDEFIGSSNKVKEATSVIMFAPDDKENQKNAGSHLRSTWCCVRKLRNGGIDNRTARMMFNVRTGTYEKSYDLKSVSYAGDIMEDDN